MIHKFICFTFIEKLNLKVSDMIHNIIIVTECYIATEMAIVSLQLSAKPSNNSQYQIVLISRLHGPDRKQTCNKMPRGSLIILRLLSFQKMKEEVIGHNLALIIVPLILLTTSQEPRNSGQWFVSDLCVPEPYNEKSHDQHGQ